MRPSIALILTEVLCTALMILNGCGKGNNQASDAPPAQKTESVQPAGNSTVLSSAASPSPAAPGIAPVVAQGQRFSEQVVELMKAAFVDQLSSRDMVIAEAPSELTERLSHSSDPVVRRLADLEKRLTDDKRTLIGKGQEAQDLRDQRLGTPARTHTETVYVPVPGGGGSMKEKREVEDENQPTLLNLTQEANAADEAKAAAEEDIRRTMDQLASECHQLGVDSAKGEKNVGDGLSVHFSDDPAHPGAVIFVENTSGHALHHCLVVIRGTQGPDDPNAPINPLAVLTGNAPHEDDGMPSITVRFLDTMPAGMKFPALACMSGQTDRWKSTTVSFWSDELVRQDYQVTGLAEAQNRLFANADALRAKAEAHEAQARHDQLANTRITTGNGMILYQMVVPEFESESILFPQGTKHCDIATDDPKLNLWISGRLFDPAAPSFPIAGFVSASSSSSTPAHVAIRFALRDLTGDEKGPFLLPPMPVSQPAPPADQRDRHEALLALVKKGAPITGTLTAFGKKHPVRLQLNWDESTSEITGWNSTDPQGVKKEVQGRIVDDPVHGPTITLRDLGPIDKTVAYYGIAGFGYFIRLQDNTPGSVAVQKATFGDPKTGRNVDVTEKVRAAVNGGSLKFRVSKALGDPAPGAVKMLSVDLLGADGKLSTVTANEGKILQVDHVRSARIGALTGSYVCEGLTLSKDNNIVFDDDGR